MVTEGHKDRVPRCERGTSATELQPFFLRMWVTADLSEQNLPLSPSCRSFGNFPFQALLFVRRWEGISLASSQGPYLWNWSALEADPLVVVVVVSFLPNQLRSLVCPCVQVLTTRLYRNWKLHVHLELVTICKMIFLFSSLGYSIIRSIIFLTGAIASLFYGVRDH